MLDFIWVSAHLPFASPHRSGSSEPHHSVSAGDVYTRGSRSKASHDTRTGQRCLLSSPLQTNSFHSFPSPPPRRTPNGVCVWPGGPGSSNSDKRQSRDSSKLCFCLLRGDVSSPLKLLDQGFFYLCIQLLTGLKAQCHPYCSDFEFPL